MSDFSIPGSRLAARSGILELMDDLGRAMTTDPAMRMLGGGNPAHIPAMDALWRRRMAEITADGDALERVLGNYDPPRGNPAFLEALAGFLNRTLGWSLTSSNLAVTAGGQCAFFYLFNLLAGEMPDGRKRRILLPLVPEYIGYANQGLSADFFAACRPHVEELPECLFKYGVDFPAVEARMSRGDIGAICVSRPTNPSGNVLTDEEIQRLSALAAAHGVPLIIDNAYGLPFPGAIFTQAVPQWAPHHILTLSLSKLGLPATRTGIVIGPPEIAEAVASMTSVTGLANTNIGQAIVRPLLESGELETISRDVIRPYYQEKAAQALAWLREFTGGSDRVRVHVPEGSFFLWLWFRGLPFTTRELYQRLKERKVLVVPGEYFFFGLEEEWSHRDECIRVNFSGPPEMVREGLRIIAEMVREG